MANYGQPNFKVSVTTSSGTTALQDISQYVTEISGFKIEAITEQSDAFGDSWQEHLWTGIRRMDDLTLSGFYNDVAATGPHALFGQTSNIGAEYEMELDFGASDIAHFDILVLSYSRMPVRNELTKYEVVVRPTGALTTAT